MRSAFVVLSASVPSPAGPLGRILRLKEGRGRRSKTNRASRIKIPNWEVGTWKRGESKLSGASPGGMAGKETEEEEVRGEM